MDFDIRGTTFSYVPGVFRRPETLRINILLLCCGVREARRGGAASVGQIPLCRIQPSLKCDVPGFTQEELNDFTELERSWEEKHSSGDLKADRGTTEA